MVDILRGRKDGARVCDEYVAGKLSRYRTWSLQNTKRETVARFNDNARYVKVLSPVPDSAVPNMIDRMVSEVFDIAGLLPDRRILDAYTDTAPDGSDVVILWLDKPLMERA